MKQIENRFPDDQKPFFRGVQMILLSVALVFVFAVSIWNAAGLRVVLNQSTQEYLYDVTSQLTRDIRDAMINKMTDLEMVSDSISRLTMYQEEESITEFLNRKARILECDPLIILDRQGNFISSDSNLSSWELTPEDYLKIPGIQSSFLGKVSANYLGGRSIFYSVPVYRDNQVEDVLVGIRSKENMQAMISSKSFNGQVVSCIVDSTGQVVISPTDLKPFLQLDDIFRKEKDSRVKSDIYQMQSDMHNGNSGILEFTAVTGEELFLAYNELEINDWFLFTLIPSDIISGGAERYIIQSFVIIAVTILIFSIFLFAVYRFYHIHRLQLERLAFVDPVTGGRNNAAFQLKYRELARSMEPGTYTVVLLNVKNFKLINERFGSLTGNRILSYIYQVLEQHVCPHKDEFVGRGESDYFFLCIRVNTPQEVQGRLDNMIQDINSFRDTNLPGCHMAFRQGACRVEDPSQEITIIQDRARLACRGRDLDFWQGCVFYDESLTEQLKKEQELNDLFEDSLENHDFHVYLQPKVRLGDEKIKGAEALVRWSHPERGVIYPSDFIPLFERNGKICGLDLYVFTEVCALIRGWIRQGRELIPVSVNLSRQHFAKEDCLDEFYRIAQEYGIPRGAIEFELTESIFFDNQQIDRVRDIIRQMHMLGFDCSLDDFGSGYSSLGLLKEFDVDTIKLDRSFFLNMTGSKARDVITCLVDLSKRLHVQVVAEGIETTEQVEYLRSIGCDMVQGYVFSKPLPAREFEKLWFEHI
ncbi:bifunctional diguanylate cyclase/phosphodiesterase [Enterocloster citroniae]|uniref:bifunctional diguanylate cyclase/phosphodiesterase n=1 Tax=Enterocloster citroniae TaxID=358743 RepID=UPI00349EDFA1